MIDYSYTIDSKIAGEGLIDIASVYAHATDNEDYILDDELGGSPESGYNVSQDELPMQVMKYDDGELVETTEHILSRCSYSGNTVV